MVSRYRPIEIGQNAEARYIATAEGGWETYIVSRESFHFVHGVLSGKTLKSFGRNMRDSLFRYSLFLSRAYERDDGELRAGVWHGCAFPTRSCSRGGASCRACSSSTSSGCRAVVTPRGLRDLKRHARGLEPPAVYTRLWMKANGPSSSPTAEHPLDRSTFRAERQTIMQNNEVPRDNSPYQCARKVLFFLAIIIHFLFLLSTPQWRTSDSMWAKVGIAPHWRAACANWFQARGMKALQIYAPHWRPYYIHSYRGENVEWIARGTVFGRLPDDIDAYAFASISISLTLSLSLCLSIYTLENRAIKLSEEKGLSDPSERLKDGLP